MIFWYFRYLAVLQSVAIFAALSISAPAQSQEARLRILQERMDATSVLSLAYSPDGKLIAAGGGVDGPENLGKHLRLLDSSNGRVSLPLEGHQYGVNTVRFSPNGKLLVSTGLHIKLWDIATGKNLMAMTEHSRVVYCAEFSPDGKTLVSGSGDGTIKLWDVISGKKLATFDANLGHGIRAVAFSPNGNKLASGETDGAIKVWDLAKRKVVAAWVAHPFGVRSLVYSRDGKLLFSGGVDKVSKSGAGPHDGGIQLWNPDSGANVATLKGHQSSVFSIALSPDGKLLASASKDKTVRLWNITERRCIATAAGHSSFVLAVAFSPDGKALVSGGSDKSIKLWSVEAER